MQDKDTRNIIVNKLGGAIANAINRNNMSRADVWAIVSTCSNYEGGLDKLINGVGLFEQESISMKNVLEFLRKFQK
ncbi:MAG: hypothetical protein GFH27_549307n79 [Chloroflexi bacterium AL-W]|nr:hypothetical protein [Chloroflexi bacterium AL-N1]NOK69111.1 hypothetical protein [Chloroflexi bacterium AL-N10]NOK77094.1 hypothetical protein [Chloroflexi bacterium AL-N5]NOK83739.1 hypothetical protein [Chloroflexi bacterium AL-W]NOK90949.1 hypothetical protein [Chloroflexi bacterium AL-N15]